MHDVNSQLFRNGQPVPTTSFGPTSKGPVIITGEITRRATLAALGTSASFLAAPAVLRAAPAVRLALYGPPAGPTFTPAHAVESGVLSGKRNEL